MSGTDQTAPTPATHSHTLDRGLRALEVLSQHPDGLSVVELARALDTHRATGVAAAGEIAAGLWR
jgi:IclR helix-turn-helix domain